MLYWRVSALSMSGRVKTIAFALPMLLTFDPQAGLNYTAFRFILHTFSLVFLSKQHRLSIAGVTAFIAAALNSQSLYAMVPNHVDRVIENKMNKSDLRYQMRMNYKYLPVEQHSCRAR